MQTIEIKENLVLRIKVNLGQFSISYFSIASESFLNSEESEEDILKRYYKSRDIFNAVGM